MLHIFLVLLLPQTLVAAPAPKDSPRPTVELLKAAMGKSHLGKEVRAIGRQLGEDPVIRYCAWSLDPAHDRGREDTCFYLIWKSKGIDVLFNDSKLAAVSLFNEGADGHKRYRGELPEGLSFDDDRQAIEKKLGKPTDVTELPARKVLGKGPEVEEVWLEYGNGLDISMQRPPGGKWAIHYISLQPKEDEKK
jgi:hypothetical protein